MGTAIVNSAELIRYCYRFLGWFDVFSSTQNETWLHLYISEQISSRNMGLCRRSGPNERKDDEIGRTGDCRFFWRGGGGGWHGWNKNVYTLTIYEKDGNYYTSLLNRLFQQ